jgi:DNA-directed RNA polymerase specialized sigma24 family protein
VEQREILVLRYVLGWPVKRIGEYLGILENTVSVSIRRSLQRLRDRWPQEMVTNGER